MIHKPRRQKFRVLIGNFDDPVNECIFDAIEVVNKNKYYRQFIVSNDGPEILELADKKSIDLFILVINNIRHRGINALEDRMENSLILINQIKIAYRRPVIALCGWKKDAFLIDWAKLSADFFFLMPFEIAVFKEAIEKCFDMLPGFDEVQ